IINTSLFATSWYIDHMKRKTYDSPPLKTTLQHKNYTSGTNDQEIINRDPRNPDTITDKDMLQHVKSDNTHTPVMTQYDHTYNTIPTKHLRLKVNKANVLKYGIVDQKDKDKIVSSIPIDISGGSIAKNTLMMFDLIANLDWTRPVYFSGGSYNDS